MKYECADVVRGDLNADCKIALADVVLALQVTADFSSSVVVNMDGAKIGIADAVYILQNISD